MNFDNKPPVIIIIIIFKQELNYSMSLNVDNFLNSGLISGMNIGSLTELIIWLTQALVTCHM